jgi:hypothetical protein
MRPSKISYTLSALDADGFCVNVTGDIKTTPWTTIAGAPADGLGHQTTLYSAANLAAITITVNGTDCENRIQSESIAGPGATTITLTKYFKTVTSVSASATLGANTMLVGWTALCATPSYPQDYHAFHPVSLSIEAGGTVDYTIQQSVVDAFNMSVDDWFIVSPPNITESSAALAVLNATATRILVNSHTAGTLTICRSQGR